MSWLYLYSIVVLVPASWLGGNFSYATSPSKSMHEADGHLEIHLDKMHLLQI